MPMPLRNSLSDYRYAYQGQEKDPETGKEAFQLRLWDARIGRWLTTDPYGQYHSPYLGMGNNPITGIDPDGGWHYDGDGNLVTDPGDTAATLQKFIGGTTGFAENQFNKNGFFIDYNTGDGAAIAGGQFANIDGMGKFGHFQSTGAATAMFPIAPIDLLFEALAPSIIEEVDNPYMLAALPLITTGKVKSTTSVSAAKNFSPFKLVSTNPITRSKSRFKKLVADIKANGIEKPILVATKDNIKYIVNGNHRAYIAKRLNIKNVPIKEVPFKAGMELMEEGGNPGYLKYIKY